MVTERVRCTAATVVLVKQSCNFPQASRFQPTSAEDVLELAQPDSPARGLRAGPGLELVPEEDGWLGVELKAFRI